MPSLRILAVTFLILPIALVAASPAGADCIGPTVGYAPSEVVRGGTVTFTGRGFGDNCYDTGPPPAGESVLGKPLTEIEIHLVQGDVDQLVATGAADEEYAFAVEAILPDSFEPGEVSVSVLTGRDVGVYFESSVPLTVTDAAPVESPGAEVAMFGPAVESGLSPGPVPEDSVLIEESETPPVAVEGDDSSPWVVVGIASIILLSGVAAWFRWRRGQQPRSARSRPSRH